MTAARRDEVISRIRARLEKEPEVNLHRTPLSLELDRGWLVMDGELETVAAKKVALEVAAAVPGVDGIVDRIRVAPSRRMSDAEILEHALRSLEAEAGLSRCAIDALRSGREESVRAWSAQALGRISVRVEEGVVTLDGDVPSLGQKRLAEALVWWVPGTRDVVNGLGVSPPQEDSDAEITDALGIVLERDPLLKGTRIGARCAGRVVTLEGAVPGEIQRRAAENDAWCLFGVDRVVNRLVVLG